MCVPTGESEMLMEESDQERDHDNGTLVESTALCDDDDSDVEALLDQYEELAEDAPSEYYPDELASDHPARCPMCANVLYRPKVLYCGHTMCANCIDKEARRSDNVGIALACPVCTSATLLPGHHCEALHAILSNTYKHQYAVREHQEAQDGVRVKLMRELEAKVRDEFFRSLGPRAYRFPYSVPPTSTAASASVSASAADTYVSVETLLGRGAILVLFIAIAHALMSSFL